MFGATILFIDKYWHLFCPGCNKPYDELTVYGAWTHVRNKFSSLTVSLLRNHTPKHIRMMVQTLIISGYVIMVDIFLKAYFPAMSETLGPYVGLIITNCIIMGRAEAFAQFNSPIPSFFDGLANGIGYALVLLFIAFFRELLGFGSLFGFNILGPNWVSWTLMIMPPGAFFMLGIVIWISKRLLPSDEDTAKGGAKHDRHTSNGHFLCSYFYKQHDFIELPRYVFIYSCFQ